jgi:hypothetical protein
MGRERRVSRKCPGATEGLGPVLRDWRGPEQGRSWGWRVEGLEPAPGRRLVSLWLVI